MPYYRRNWGYRYWGRRYGVQRAQQQGTRRFSVSIPIEGAASIGVAANSVNSSSCGFQPFFNTNRAGGTATRDHCVGTLVGNNLFATYCNLYDEVKLNSFYVEIAVTGLPESKQAVKVVTCIDRHATIDDIDSSYTVTNMMGSAECDSKMFTSLNYSKVSRYFRARDKQERDIFVDSSLGTRVVTLEDTSTYQIAGIKEFLDNGNLYGAFNPLMSLGFVLGSSPAASATVSFQYRVVWNLTFRNPKYGSSSVSRGVGMLMSDGVDREEQVGGSVEKKVKFDESVKEESVAPVDDLEMGDESSQPQLTKEELLEMLKKYDEK